MTDEITGIERERRSLDLGRGFLPDAAPLTSFGSDAHRHLQTLDELADALPSLIERDALRSKLRGLDAPPDGLFDRLTRRELVRVYSVTGFLASAYVHKVGDEVVHALPPGVAIPLYESTDRLGRTPMLSYDGYVLNNWTLEDPRQGLRPHNVRTVTSFVSGRDERWFVAVHLAIEAAAASAIDAIDDLQQAISEDVPAAVHRNLRTTEDALHRVVGILNRMPEHNDPEAFRAGFRPYLKSFENVTYEGVPELDGPQSYRGASGAQTGLFAALDAVLGIDHGDNPLVSHLRVLREDIPPSHRSFVESVESGPNVREYVASADDDRLREAYNECIDRLVTFREHHVDIVDEYIAGPTDEAEGTGGTPYNRYLEAFVRDTERQRL